MKRLKAMLMGGQSQRTLLNIFSGCLLTEFESGLLGSIQKKASNNFDILIYPNLRFPAVANATYGLNLERERGITGSVGLS